MDQPQCIAVLFVWTELAGKLTRSHPEEVIPHSVVAQDSLIDKLICLDRS